MKLNQYQCGIQYNKQGGGNGTWKINHSCASPDQEGFCGWCEYLSGYTFDCDLTKHVDTYHRSMEEFISYLSVNSKYLLYLSEAVEIKSTYLLKKPLNPKAT